MIQWNDDIKFRVCGPLVDKDEEMKDGEEDVDMNPDSDSAMNKKVDILDLSAPIEKYGFISGSTVHVFGTVKCQSELPSTCMTHEYEQGSDKSYNYYQCLTCKIKWVCQACAKNCHEK